jgi:hypothetical protein
VESLTILEQETLNELACYGYKFYGDPRASKALGLGGLLGISVLGSIGLLGLGGLGVGRVLGARALLGITWAPRQLWFSAIVHSCGMSCNR